jgi:hypothetical protein
MLPRVVAAILVTHFGLVSSGLAQPPGQTTSRPVSDEAPLGHTGLVLGGGVSAGRMLLSGAEGIPLDAGLEAFLGWSFGRVAYCAWSKIHLDKADEGHFNLGGAMRLWPWPRFRRLYTEARLGYEAVGLVYAGNPCGDDTPPEECERLDGRRGAVVGGSLGFELFTSDFLTFDLRAGLQAALILDHPGYVLLDLGLAAHIY